MILVLLGLLFLVRQFDNANVQSSYNYDYGYDYDYEEDDEYARTARLSSSTQPRSSEQKVYRHALEAVTRAGLDPDDVQLLGSGYWLDVLQRYRLTRDFPYLVTPG